MSAEVESGPVRTLVVWCLDWPVVALGVDPDRPAAVFVANRVVAATPAARARGVRRHQRRREAQARCPDLVVLERDLDREARFFEAVVAAVEAFAPRLEITRPGTCAVATRGPSRYFGGDEVLAGEIRTAVAGVLAGRTDVRVGVADGPFAAGLAARSTVAADTGCHVVAPGESAEFLAPLPVRSLGRPDLVDVLVRLGLTTLGAVAALPRSDLVGRFGAEGSAAHRLASGLDERPLDARVPADDLAVALELDPPVERIDQAAFAARALAEALGERLEHRGVVCTRVAIEAETEHGESLVRLWRHEGALTTAALADRARWQLAGWLDGPARCRPSGGLTRLALVPDEVVAARGRQLGFWGGATAADERAARALARLGTVLGPEAVRVPEWRGGRHPDRLVALVPAQAVDVVDRAESGLTAPSPPWPGRLPPPHPATVMSRLEPVEVLDAAGRPVVVSGRGVASSAPEVLVADGGRRRVVAWAGPWPVEERWWDPERADRRARFQLVTDDGAAHLVARRAGTWALEARYD